MCCFVCETVTHIGGSSAVAAASAAAAASARALRVAVEAVDLRLSVDLSEVAEPPRLQRSDRPENVISLNINHGPTVPTQHQRVAGAQEGSACVLLIAVGLVDKDGGVAGVRAGKRAAALGLCLDYSLALRQQAFVLLLEPRVFLSQLLLCFCCGNNVSHIKYIYNVCRAEGDLRTGGLAANRLLVLVALGGDGLSLGLEVGVFLVD